MKTSQPFPIRPSTMWDPMNPAPPVTQVLHPATLLNGATNPLDTSPPVLPWPRSGRFHLHCLRSLPLQHQLPVPARNLRLAASGEITPHFVFSLLYLTETAPTEIPA